MPSIVPASAAPRQLSPALPTRFWLAVCIVLVVTVGLLRWEGRPWWCACGRLAPWAGDVQSSHNSQHLFDPYTFTHVPHGLVLCGLFAWVLPRISPRRRLCLALLSEAAWEVVENSQFVIERYRTATIALGYEGDSVANSLGDILACCCGYIVASRIGWRWSSVLFVALELLMLFWIRDNLTLNIVMLVYPIEAIKTWQSGQ